MSSPSITDALSEALETTRKAISERLGNPFVFAFLLSWCVLNYKLLMIVFGDGKTIEKLALIDWLIRCTEDQGASFWATPMAFAVLYQFLDILMVAGARHIANLKQRISLEIDRKQPVAMDRQDEFFAELRKNLEEAHAELRKAREVAALDRSAAAAVIDPLHDRFVWVLRRYHKCLEVIYQKWPEDEVIPLLTGRPVDRLSARQRDNIFGPRILVCMSAILKQIHSEPDDVVPAARLDYMLYHLDDSSKELVIEAFLSLGILVRTYEGAVPTYTYLRNGEGSAHYRLLDIL